MEQKQSHQCFIYLNSAGTLSYNIIVFMISGKRPVVKYINDYVTNELKKMGYPEL